MLRVLSTIAAVLMLWPITPSFAAGVPVVVTADVAYGPLPRQKLDIYAPADGDDGGPVLVFFYGGTWQNGSKAYLRAIGEAVAVKGITFVVPDYRLYPRVVFPAFVEDCALAVSYVWRNLRAADGTPRAIFVGGHSAGAYNAGMVAFNQQYLAADAVPAGTIKGFVGIAGAYAPIIFDHSGLEEIFPEAERQRSAIVDFVDQRDPPMLLIGGGADRIVSIRHVHALADVAAEAGLEVTVSVYPGFDHMGVYFAMMDPHSAISRDITTFIDGIAGSAARVKP